MRNYKNRLPMLVWVVTQTYDDIRSRKEPQQSRAKHGVALAAAEGFDWETADIREDASETYGERREIATGFIGTVLHVYVYTLRGEEDHAISLRKAKPHEKRRYAQNL